ncbi:class I SAM-dependent methyltransferase [Patescibacteria group bacterium]|nr:class I SAM-dependent methyltransferase [Patescibacteria group bacterium]MBU1722127.1 class I SAM-dependent methyltransferase [Patescibacteria group bacterium]MBU1901176.1 class I SAM-dependent methyltransferase [Patescibacteria group bacterium]
MDSFSIDGSYTDVLVNIITKKDILHVGCVGTWSVDNKKNFSAHKMICTYANSVEGIDIDEKGIAMMNSEGFTCLVASAESYKTEKKYDVVLIPSVLQFVSDPLAAVSHLATYLKPDGLMCIDVPHVYGFSNILRHAQKFDAIKKIQLNGQSEIGEVSLFHAASLANIIIQSGLTHLYSRTYIIKKMSKNVSYKENLRIFLNNVPWYLNKKFGPSLLCIAQKKK